MSHLANFQKKHGQEYFRSSCSDTPEFLAFFRALKRAFSSDLKENGNLKLEKFSKGHFYASGFLVNPEGNCVYFSVKDVRPYADLEQVLFRTAKDTNDYTGGHNHYGPLGSLLKNAESLMARA